MEVDWYYRLLSLVVLLIASAFFSGSEVALFSLDKKKIKELQKERNLTSRYIINLIESPRSLLVTILLGNNFINVAASIIAVTLALDAAAFYNISIEVTLLSQIIILTVLILIFGEITPKVWATKYPLTFSRAISLPLYWVGVIVYPVSKIIAEILKAISSKFDIGKDRTAILTSELTDLADLSVEKGTIEEDEHELISSLVGFKNITVREIMTPRVDMTAVSIDTDFDELLKLIVESGHSRIPLYEESLDKILGIIYAKDLLPYIGKSDQVKSNLILKNIAREMIFVPETKLINELLHDFQSKNLHLGIAVDEYGGTSGLVSLEDILEEIVGEIRDEYDIEEEEIVKISTNKYSVLGKLPIDELNELFNYDFSSEDDDYDTVGGFIFNHAGTIPEENYSMDYEGFIFTVKEVINNRINKVLIESIQSGSKE